VSASTSAAALLAVTLLAVASPSRGDAPDTLSIATSSAGEVEATGARAASRGWRDAGYGAAAAATIAVVAANDRALLDRIRGGGTRPAHQLAQVGDALGDPIDLAPVLLAADGFARLTGRRPAAAALERVALSAAAAVVPTLVLKDVVGRWRPNESPSDAARFTPFSGHDSFPSGHATLAFGVASALASESRRRWVPAVVYPLAALTAWARVHDVRHWPSDVAAGAAIGGWVAHEADALARRRLPQGLWVAGWPLAGGGRVSAGARF
jgi:membrane-associated phospholipid phosphatase